MKLLRNILKGASLTTALFVFQACYGMLQTDWEDYASFKVVSAEDNTPLENIAVKVKEASSGSDSDWKIKGYTYEDGTAYVSFGNADYRNSQFRFESEDGTYVAKDTVISDFSHLIQIRLLKAD